MTFVGVLKKKKDNLNRNKGEHQMNKTEGYSIKQLTCTPPPCQDHEKQRKIKELFKVKTRLKYCDN
jgi:hypothetical protein